MITVTESCIKCGVPRLFEHYDCPAGCHRRRCTICNRDENLEPEFSLRDIECSCGKVIKKRTEFSVVE